MKRYLDQIIAARNKTITYRKDWDQVTERSDGSRKKVVYRDGVAVMMESNHASSLFIPDLVEVGHVVCYTWKGIEFVHYWNGLKGYSPSDSEGKEFVSVLENQYDGDITDIPFLPYEEKMKIIKRFGE